VRAVEEQHAEERGVCEGEGQVGLTSPDDPVHRVLRCGGGLGSTAAELREAFEACFTEKVFAAGPIAPEAADQLQSLYRYVAEASSPQVAADYVEAIVAHCEGLAVFPYRGTMRDDLRPGLRTTLYNTATPVQQKARTQVLLGSRPMNAHL